MCRTQEKERCEYQKASKRNAVEKAARLQAEVDRLSAQAADAVDALESAHISATESKQPGAQTEISDNPQELATLEKKLEETLEMAAAATELAESEAAERKKLSAELQESASRESELRLLAENAIAAATSSAAANATEESEASKAAAAATAAACEQRRVAMERSEALEKELSSLRNTIEEQPKDIATKLVLAEEQREDLAAKLTASMARAEAAEQRAADLDASLATSSASDSAALSAVRSELSERCHAVTKLERELREVVAAKETAANESKALAQNLEACQAELKTTLEEAIETRISFDALTKEFEASKAGEALATELAETKKSLVEAVECGEAAADALAELRLMSKGRWKIGDTCEIVVATDRDAHSDTASASSEIELDKACYSGTIRFLGEATIGNGDDTESSQWVGVELSAPVGRNDGSVHGVRYFHCAPQHGVMVRPDRLLLPTHTAASSSSVESEHACDSETLESLREQVASMTADLKRATQSRRQADATRKKLEASLNDANSKIDAHNALLVQEQTARAKADNKAVTLSQELARVNEEAKRLQGYLSSKPSSAVDKRYSGMTLEEREAALVGRERLLDERQARVDASHVAQEALDKQSRELKARETALAAQAARIADEQAELENAKAFLEDFPMAAAASGSSVSASSDEQSRRAAAWQQKRTQEMMTLKRRNQTLEAGSERLKAELESARTKTESLEGQLAAEVAASKARNSSTWRLRQENERLLKAELAWKEQQAEWQRSGTVTLGSTSEVAKTDTAAPSDIISATEVQALHAKVAEAKQTIDSLEAANEQRNQSITALRTELAQAKAAERVVSVTSSNPLGHCFSRRRT